MKGVEKATIPFRIKMAEGSFKGFVTGNKLEDHSTYVVQLANGEDFLVEAINDREIFRYNWSCIKDDFNNIVPIIGKIIERHFSKM